VSWREPRFAVQTLLLGLVLATAAPAPALATVVVQLSRHQLRAEAHVIVEGEVVAVHAEGAPAAIFTLARVKVSAWRKGGPGHERGHEPDTLIVRVPGGRVGQHWRVVVGMPRFEQGERVRLYLVKQGGYYRPVGLHQGVVRLSVGERRGPGAAVMAYKLNGFKWDASRIPVPYYINEKGSDDLGQETFTIIQQSMATWEKVPCSHLRMDYKGKTKVEAGKLDKMNVLSWVEKGWTYGKFAAAATSYIGKGDMAQADIAFNGENFTWKKGGGTVLWPFDVDPASVITHEVGHMLGLSHTTVDNMATMAAAYVPGGLQSSLGSDDKLGLCKIYPAKSPKDECQTDCDCPKNSACKYFKEVGVRLCDEHRDPDNTACTEASINCPGHCYFYELDAITKKGKGYCTTECAKAGAACAGGWTCKEGTSNQGEKKLVCQSATPKPVPPPKRPRNCAAKDMGVDGAAPPPGEGDDEGECRVSPSRTVSPPGALALLALLLLLRRRRRIL